jgi:hypothetical protein
MMFRRHPIGVIVVAAAMFVWSVGWSQQRKTSSLSHDGYRYSYENIPIYEPGNDKPVNHDGRITVLNSGGDEVYRSAAYAPGCEGDVPPLGLLELPVKRSAAATARRTQTFVMFCGNAGSAHNTVRLFKPGSGEVAVLDFMYGPAKFDVSPDGEYVARVIYQVALRSLGITVPYLVLYRFEADAAHAGFSAATDAFMASVYRRYIQENLEQLSSDGKLDSGVRALLASAQVRDAGLYGEIEKELEKKAAGRAASVMNELRTEFDLPR